MIKSAIAAIVMAAGLATGSLAGSSRSIQKQEPSAGALPIGLHQVIYVYAASGNPSQTLNTGYNTVQSVTLNCPGVNSTCMFVMKIMAQIGNAPSTGQWVINVSVDGQSVDGGSLLGDMPAANKLQIRNWYGQYPVSGGNHTGEFQLNVPSQAVAYQYAVT